MCTVTGKCLELIKFPESKTGYTQAKISSVDPPLTTLVIKFEFAGFDPKNIDVIFPNVMDMISKEQQCVPYDCTFAGQKHHLTAIVYGGDDHFVCSFLIPDRKMEDQDAPSDTYSWHYYDDLSVRGGPRLFSSQGLCTETGPSQFGMKPAQHPMKFAADCYIAHRQGRKPRQLDLCLAIYTAAGADEQP